MAEVAQQSSSGFRLRLRLAGHRFLSRWKARHTLALVVFSTLLLVIAANVDPRIRAGLGYARAPSRYVVPVAGVAPQAIRSSWHDPRSGGRAHEGCDILASRGTAVVAATDGVVWSVGVNELGGRAVYVLGEGLDVYYYAHLDAWAPGLLPGDKVRAGDVLGAVGDSGDARGGPTHLHFGVDRLSIFGSRWVDPAPLLTTRGVAVPKAILSGGVKDPPVSHGPAGGRESLIVRDGH